ncbi:MAG: RluA family pseudouridine synthase [Caldisericaceae bacterium]
MENTFEADNSERLDLFLVEKSGKSRSSVQKLVRQGFVAVNGRIITKSSFLIKSGDVISYKEPELVALSLEKDEHPIKIVYEDKYLLIVDKEAGLTVHPVGSRVSNTLVNRLLFSVKDLSGIGGTMRPGIVHRLDKDTSGLMVVAKNDEAHIKLSRMLKEHQIKRKYIALVKGNFKERTGTINLPIKRKQGETKMTISVLGREAITHYRVLESIGPYSLMQVELETGRTHQIRVHFSHIGHPLVGDQLYGGKNPPEITLKRQFLHSYEISFRHPIIGNKVLRFSCLPYDLVDTLRVIRKKWKNKE